MAAGKVLIRVAVLALGGGVLASVANAALPCGRIACRDEAAASGLKNDAGRACLTSLISDCSAGLCSCTGGSPPCSCVCGDGLCGPSEDCGTCPQDCGTCPTTTTTSTTTTTTQPPAVCGNGVVEPGEQCDGTSCGMDTGCGSPSDPDACQCCTTRYCGGGFLPNCCAGSFCARSVFSPVGYCTPFSCTPETGCGVAFTCVDGTCCAVPGQSCINVPCCPGLGTTCVFGACCVPSGSPCPTGPVACCSGTCNAGTCQ
jgi:hypothetical protein